MNFRASVLAEKAILDLFSGSAGDGAVGSGGAARANHAAGLTCSGARGCPEARQDDGDMSTYANLRRVFGWSPQC